MNSSGVSAERQQEAAALKRLVKQKVLNILRKLDNKSKGLKKFYFFSYESAVPARRDHCTSSYFFNGERCEGDEQFLKQMKRSVYVCNIPPGTRKTEIGELFSRFGQVSSIQLKTRSGKSIVGRQHISSYNPISCIVEFTNKDEAESACKVKAETDSTDSFVAKPLDDTLQYGADNCIQVENVDPKTTKFEVREYFKAFGVIKSINMVLNDGSLVLTDKEYGQLQSVNCYVRFHRRSDARTAESILDRSSFKDNIIRVQTAYQKLCKPNDLTNNELRIFFQAAGNVLSLDQVPNQRAGYVCFKPPLAVENVKRINQQTFRNKRVFVEKLDVALENKIVKPVGNEKIGSLGGSGDTKIIVKVQPKQRRVVNGKRSLMKKLSSINSAISGRARVT